MKVTKTVILIDGGFFVQRFMELNKYDTTHRTTKKPITIKPFPTIKDVRKLIKNIMVGIKDKPEHTVDYLFRVLYYDCYPFGETVNDPKGKSIDFSKSKSFSNQSKLLDSLKMEQQVALRLGQLSFGGWQIDKYGKNKPSFRQKSVDMKIGLDMALMSGKKTVDKMVLVTGDSDFVSPMKLVRKEGILVYLYAMKQKQIKNILKEHADFII